MYFICRASLVCRTFPKIIEINRHTDNITQMFVSIKNWEGRNVHFTKDPAMSLGESSVLPLFAELLVGAGSASPADLKRCIEISFDRGSILSEVMISEGLLNTRILVETIRLQRLVRHAGLEVDRAVELLKDVIHNERELVTALLDMGWITSKLACVSEVGRILLDSQLVEPELLSSAATQALRSSLPLGAHLVKEEVISQTTLWSALKAIAVADSGKMSREEILEYFKTAVKRQFLLELVLPEAEDSRRRGEWIRLGELLATGGIISDMEILTALEGAMDLGVPLGKFLVMKLILTTDQVQRALDIQTLVSTGQITPLQAAGVAKAVLARDVPVSEAVKKVRDTAEYVRKATKSNKIIAIDENLGQ